MAGRAVREWSWIAVTIHHVALGQLQKNSTAQRDYVKDGFYAATGDAENEIARSGSQRL